MIVSSVRLVPSVYIRQETKTLIRLIKLCHVALRFASTRLLLQLLLFTVGTVSVCLLEHLSLTTNPCSLYPVVQEYCACNPPPNARAACNTCSFTLVACCACKVLCLCLCKGPCLFLPISVCCMPARLPPNVPLRSLVGLRIVYRDHLFRQNSLLVRVHVLSHLSPATTSSCSAAGVTHSTCHHTRCLSIVLFAS